MLRKPSGSLSGQRMAPPHLGLILCCCTAWGAASLPQPMIKQLNVRIPMRDGVHLSANIFRPAGAARAPTILIRTPYGKGSDLLPAYQSFVDRGYGVVMQDVRGRYASEGVFDPPAAEGRDGSDTLDWIAGEPWSNGKVGMIGGSYLGIVQWRVALLNNPHLKAISPVVSGDDEYRDRYYSPGGAMKLGHRLLWLRENLRAAGFASPDFDRFVLHLPLRTSDRAATGRTSLLWQQAMDHPADDSFWRSISVRDEISRIRVPVLAFGGWYDNYCESDLEAFAALHARPGANNRVVIGPWPHNMSIKFPGVDFGPHSSAPVRSMQIEWMDHWLKGVESSPVSRAPVRIFVMGINQWRDESEWPLARSIMTPFYLKAKAAANSLNGAGELSRNRPGKEAPDLFSFNPRDPVPTRGGAVCCNPKVFPWGPMDQRPVERRPDVLVYTSGPLRKDVEVTGPIRVVLYAATSGSDTDFTAKLVDVFPDGEARNLTDGILRLRYRESLEKPALATPGQTYQIAIDAGVTSNVFLKGHRIRLEISSSNFPRFDRNPNTGRPVADETDLRKASQTVYHDRAHASYVLLPVTPAAGGAKPNH
jgi:putative CocE/NonD family hydrolase